MSNSNYSAEFIISDNSELQALRQTLINAWEYDTGTNEFEYYMHRGEVYYFRNRYTKMRITMKGNVPFKYKQKFNLTINNNDNRQRNNRIH